jgi:hypothetical protein
MMGNVNCLRCRFRHEDNGNCTAVGGFCTAVTAAHCPLLREYLDTWLTPEEIKAPFTEDAMINLAAQALGVDIGRLNELAEADKDGRVVVLPCKVGDTVFARLDTKSKYVCECKVKQIVVGNIGFVTFAPIGAPEREYDVSLRGFGKTVFLSREEAEKALQEMEGKKDGNETNM